MEFTEAESNRTISFLNTSNTKRPPSPGTNVEKRTSQQPTYSRFDGLKRNRTNPMGITVRLQQPDEAVVRTWMSLQNSGNSISVPKGFDLNKW